MFVCLSNSHATGPNEVFRRETIDSYQRTLKKRIKKLIMVTEALGVGPFSIIVDPHVTNYILQSYLHMRPIGKNCEQWFLQKGGCRGCDGSHVYGDKRCPRSF